MLKEWLKSHNDSLDNFHFDGYDIAKYSIKNRQFWSSFSDERKNIIIESAEKYLNYSIPEIKATYYLEFKRTGNRSIMEAPSFARRTALCCLTLGECVENAGRFIDDLINVLIAICEESFWGVSAHSYPLIPDMEQPVIDLFAAETAAIISWSMVMISEKLDEISPDIKHRIDHEIEHRIKTPFMTRDFGWTGTSGKSVNNWNPWIISNIISVYLFSENDETKKRAGLIKALEYLDNFIISYPEDGGCDEGTGYWSVAGGALFDALEQLYIASNGKISFFDEPLIEKIVEYLRHLHVYNRNFVNYADGNIRPNPPGGLIYRFGKYINNEDIKSFGAFLFNTSKLEKQPRMLRRYLMDLINEKEIISYKYAYSYETDSCMPKLEVITAREDKCGNHGFFLSVKGGHNNESHNHNDVGNFIVYLNGMPTVIDAGVGIYTRLTFSSERYSIWTMRSEWHNLPQINTTDTVYNQLPGRDKKSHNFTYECTSELVTVSLELQNAYDIKTGLEKLTRKIEFCRKNNVDSYIAIIDNFIFSKAVDSITENILLSREPIIFDDHVVIMLDNNTGIRISFDKLNISASKDSVSLLSDSNLKNSWQTDALWRLRLTKNNVLENTTITYKLTPIYN